MIESEILENLPVDDSEALIELEERLSAHFGIKHEISNFDGNRAKYLAYASTMLSALDSFDVEYFSAYSMAEIRLFNAQEFYNFYTDIHFFITKLKLKCSRRRTQYSVALDDQEKKEIRNHVDSIREIILDSNLSEPKKERILKKLSSLQLEVDKNRTRLEVVADFATSLSHIARDTAHNGIKPVIDEIRPILEIFGASKASEEDTRQLPGPKKREKIEPPRKRLPPPEKFDDSEV
ncbi:MAG: hypothetical protein AAGF15_02135 [Pseudomonadota bacterium]